MAAISSPPGDAAQPPGARATPAQPREEPRPRIRDLGIAPGILPPGPLDAITDVDGVRVGHHTLAIGDGVRTGVTAIVPAPGNLFRSKLPAAVYAANAFGKAAGFLQVRELGTLETPIVLTNTLAVGTAVEAVVRWTLAQPGNEDAQSVNAVVGETNDGWLNDIRARTVREEHVVAALEAARSGPVDEGAVGAGTGTRALGFKGGIGTASRRLPASLGGYTVGALVQSNFGGVLTIDGVRVGERLGRYSFREQLEPLEDPEPPGSPEGAAARRDPPEEGSVMIVLATDAPLEPRNLERVARRAPLGLARTGSFMSNGSGDFVIAFSTAYRVPHAPEERTRSVELLHDDFLGPLFLAAIEAVEEAVYNSLVRATTTTGFEGRTVEALPLDRLRELFADRGR
jgi:D-aminopeptidase